MELKEGFGFNMDRTLKKVNQVYLRHFAENNIDLTIEQWVVLQKIKELGEEVSQADIAKFSYRNRATTSRVLGGLCKKGLVKKDRFEGDLKRYRLTISKRGHRVLTKTLPIVEQLRRIGKNHISKKDFDIFLRVLDQLWNKYDEIEGLSYNQLSKLKV